MKRILCLFLVLLTVLSLAGCGEYFNPLDRPIEQPPAIEDPNKDPADLVNDPTAYTVSIRYDGKPYIPRAQDGVKAQWSDGYHIYSADFGEDGVARIGNLDGDYQVSLVGLPGNYLYNTNAYQAKNSKDGRHVTIDIYQPAFLQVPPVTTNYNGVKISGTGVFRIELKSADQKIFFVYSPTEAGSYAVESWVNTAEGQYNPKVDVYQGSSFYNFFSFTLDDGGYEKGYTKNFKHIVEVAKENISTSGGGSANFIFAIHADSKNGIYPMYLDFAITLNGDFSLDHANKTVIIPAETFAETPDYVGHHFAWAETSLIGAGGGKLFDDDLFAIWPKGTGILLQRPNGAAAGSTPAEILSGQYCMLYQNMDADLSREITFTPDGAGATAGRVEILDYYFITAGGQRTKQTTPRCAGSYRYVYNEDGSVGLTHLSGDLIDFAAFSIDGNRLLYGKGDDYYHLVDRENGSFGAILYAKVSAPHRFTAEAFTNIEDAGNSALTVNGWENHRLFFLGLQNMLFDELANNPQGRGPYFCVHGCPCRDAYDGIGIHPASCMTCQEYQCRTLPDAVYDSLILGHYYCAEDCPCANPTKKNYQRDHVCDASCTKCLSTCSRLPVAYQAILDGMEEHELYAEFIPVGDGISLIRDATDRWLLMDNRALGYAAFANEDGVYAVTAELQHFLQSFSISQRYFADGQGWVEQHPTYKVDAPESAQWLFACGYYVRD